MELEHLHTLAGCKPNAPVVRVNDTTIAVVRGNGVRVLEWSENSSTIASERLFLVPGISQGISALAVCTKSQRLAVAQIAQQPIIHVFSLPDMKPVAQLSGRARGEYSSMDFSRDGTLMVAMGGEFNREVDLFDTGVMARIETENAATAPERCHSVRFSPTDRFSFASWGSTGLYFWRIDQAHTTFRMLQSRAMTGYSDSSAAAGSSQGAADANDMDKEVTMHEIESITQSNDARTAALRNCGPTAFTWMSDGSACSALVDGSLSRYDPESGSMISRHVVSNDLRNIQHGEHRSPLVEPDYVAAMLVTRSHLLAATRDGFVHWLSLPTLQHVFKMKVADNGCTDEYIHSMLPGRLHRAVLAFSSAGAIVSFPATAPRVKTPTLNHPSSNQDDDLPPPVSIQADGAAKLNMRRVRDGHARRVNSISQAPLEHAPTAMYSVGDDQSLRVWDAKAGELIDSCLDLGHLTTTASAPGLNLVAVGTGNGHVHIFTVRTDDAAAGTRRLARLSSFHVHSSAVRNLCLSEDGRLLASSAQRDSDVCVLDVSDMVKPKLVAYAHVDQVTSIQWMDGSNALVMALANPSVVVTAETRTVGHSPTVLELEPVVALEFKLRLSHMRAIGHSLFIAFPGNDSLVRAIRSRETGQFSVVSNPVNDSNSVVSGFTYNSEEDDAPVNGGGARVDGLSCVAVTTATSLVATGSGAGRITVYQIDGDLVYPIASTLVSCSAVTALEFTVDGQHVVFATSDDVGLSVLRLSGSDQLASKAAAAAAAVTGVVNLPTKKFAASEDNWATTEKSTTFLDQHYASAKKEQEEAYSQAKIARRLRLQGVRNKLERLLERNKRADPLEQLDRREFVVDLEGQKVLREAAEKEAKQKEEAIRNENKTLQEVIDRIKTECWDPFVAKGANLLGLKSQTRVANFAIKEESPHELATRTHILRMRKIELREQRASSRGPPMEKFYKVSFDDATNWIMNAGTLRPDLDKLFANDTGSSGGGNSGPSGGASGSGGGGSGVEKGSGSADKKDVVKGAEGNEAAEHEGDHDGAHGDGVARGASITGSAKPDDNDDDDDVDREEIVDLLYHPAVVRTPAQKRTQICLLKTIVQQMRQRFNDHFDQTMRLKEDEMDKIAAKNERVVEILSELKSDDDVFVPKLSATELPDDVIKVKDSEVDVERHVSKAEQERLAIEAEEKRRRDAENAKGSTGERALQDMMNGTLEQKKDTALEVELERPEWMNAIEYDDMTEDQRQEFDEFVVKEKALEAEREKRRKQLELELKKLKIEINEIIRHFDEKVEALFQMKINVLRQIKAQELYISRLILSTMETQNAREEIVTLNDHLDKLEGEKVQLYQALKHFKSQYDDHTDQLRQLQEDDRALERGFKSAMNEASAEVLDSDTMKVLQHLFKQRNGKPRPDFFDAEARGSFSLVRRSSINRRKSRGNSFVRASLQGHGEGGIPTGFRSSLRNVNQTNEGSFKASGQRDDHQHGNESGERGEGEGEGGGGGYGKEDGRDKEEDLDPFGPLGQETEWEKQNREQAAALAPLDLETDCPEGFLIEQNEWQRLQLLRHEKILSELRVKEKAGESVQMGRRLHDLQSKYRQIAQSIGSTKRRIGDLEQLVSNSIVNTELVIQLSQGIDEVPSEMIVTGYNDSILLNRSVIEKENEQIRKLGKAKVGTLHKMKEFRKSINYMQWEHQFMEFKAHDLDEHYTDLHMLRVTRSLQEFIKGGSSGNRNKEKVAQAEAKIEHMKRAHKTRLEKLQRSQEKLDQQAAQKEQENSRLRGHCAQLESNVTMLENVRNTRSSMATGGDVSDESVMNSIITKRRLKDLVLAQAEEIDFLAKELDRVRRKTYPCFSKSFDMDGGKYKAPDDNFSDGGL